MRACNWSVSTKCCVFMKDGDCRCRYVTWRIRAASCNYLIPTSIWCDQESCFTAFILRLKCSARWLSSLRWPGNRAWSISRLRSQDTRSAMAPPGNPITMCVLSRSRSGMGMGTFAVCPTSHRLSSTAKNIRRLGAFVWTRSWSTSSSDSAFNGDEVILIGQPLKGKGSLWRNWPSGRTRFPTKS